MAIQTNQETEILGKIVKQSVKFRTAHERTRAQQKFNTDDIYIIKAGKKIFMQEMINAANEDAELIPTLKKYGTIETIVRQKPEDLNWGEENKNLTLVDAKNAMDKAKELWESLNVATREWYKNDFDLFLQNFEKDRATAIQQKLDFEKAEAEKIKNNEPKDEVNDGK